MGTQTIADRIKLLRGNKSQKEFADILKIRRNYISNYESGKIKPTTEFYIALIERLNINLEWLLTGKGEKFQSTNLELSEKIQENYSLKDELTILKSKLAQIKGIAEVQNKIEDEIDYSIGNEIEKSLENPIDKDDWYNTNKLKKNLRKRRKK